MIPQEELNRFMANLNQAAKTVGKFDGNAPEIPQDAVLAMLHGYLFLAKENGVPVPEYEIIRKALQDITNWITIGLDIETFSMSETATPASKDHVLLEL